MVGGGGGKGGGRSEEIPFKSLREGFVIYKYKEFFPYIHEDSKKLTITNRKTAHHLRLGR
jgi:hypothetical protein